MAQSPQVDSFNPRSARRGQWVAIRGPLDRRISPDSLATPSICPTTRNAQGNQAQRPSWMTHRPRCILDAMEGWQLAVSLEDRLLLTFCSDSAAGAPRTLVLFLSESVSHSTQPRGFLRGGGGGGGDDSPGIGIGISTAACRHWRWAPGGAGWASFSCWACEMGAGLPWCVAR